jgi:hypothetical protein
MESLLLVDRSFLDARSQHEFAARHVELYRLLNENERARQDPLARPVQVLANPGLEEQDSSAPLGWNRFGTGRVERDSLQTHTGQTAAVVSTLGGFTQTVAVRPGEMYTLNQYVRSDLPDSSMRVQLNWLDPSGELIEASINVHPARSEWQLRELTATAPEGAASVVVYLNAQSGEAWVDDVTLERRS